jgi:hypothetical protein
MILQKTSKIQKNPQKKPAKLKKKSFTFHLFQIEKSNFYYLTLLKEKFNPSIGLQVCIWLSFKVKL